MARAKIMIVEDDPSTIEVMSLRLQQEGYDVAAFGLGGDALSHFAAEAPDLVILDIMLPDTDGLSICREIRRKSNIPIIMVTGRGEKLDRVVGLEVGADDYVVKPFMSDELLARVRAHLRRVTDYSESSGGERVVKAGGLELDMQTHQVARGSEKIDLTPTEFRMLLALVEANGAVLSPASIFEKVWGREGANQSLIETHIYNLRRKVEDNASAPRIILTIRDAGYRFNADTAR